MPLTKEQAECNERAKKLVHDLNIANPLTFSGTPIHIHSNVGPSYMATLAADEYRDCMNEFKAQKTPPVEKNCSVPQK